MYRYSLTISYETQKDIQLTSDVGFVAVALGDGCLGDNDVLEAMAFLVDKQHDESQQADAAEHHHPIYHLIHDPFLLRLHYGGV